MRSNIKIFTVHVWRCFKNLNLVPFNKNDLTAGKLIMKATAKTYRYLQEDEQ